MLILFVFELIKANTYVTCCGFTVENACSTKCEESYCNTEFCNSWSMDLKPTFTSKRTSDMKDIIDVANNTNMAIRRRGWGKPKSEQSRYEYDNVAFGSWEQCTNSEGQYCQCNGLAAYGRGYGHDWTFSSSSSEILCGHWGTFGRDPSKGNHDKQCWCAPLQCRNGYGGYCRLSKEPDCYCNPPTPQVNVDCSDITCNWQEFVMTISVGDCGCEDYCCYKRGGGGAKCFSAKGMVSTNTQGRISLEALQVGDQVEDDFNSYTKVVGFLHRDTSTVVSFLKLASNTSHIIVSHDHLLATGGGFVKAKHVHPGMQLSTSCCGNQEIIQVEEVLDRGVYAPLTESGVLVVNGFIVSCYANIPAEFLWLANILFWPRKMLMSRKLTNAGVDLYAGILRTLFYFPCLLLNEC